jgi:Spx/MgsR family transcriptional regulator
MADDLTLYGIPNCDSVKKARVWLADAGKNYRFHDYKKQGVDKDSLARWVDVAGLERVLNRQGTTWRKLSDAEKASAANVEGALALMMAQPSLIKRPILEARTQLQVGFDAAQWLRALD